MAFLLGADFEITQLRTQCDSPKDYGDGNAVRDQLKPQLWLQMKPTKKPAKKPTKKTKLYSGFSAKETNLNMRPSSNIMLRATFLPIPLGEHKPNEKEKPPYTLNTLCEHGILMPAEL